MRKILSFTVLGTALSLTAFAASPTPEASGTGKPAAPSGPVNFNRDVRPILSDNCFACHGPDPEKREAGLRLDVEGVATKESDSGATAIVPGKPEESELVKRLTTADPDEKMPPAKSHKKVTPAQIEIIKKWIAEGAKYQGGHWAFVPPVRPALPAVKDEKWVRTPVDRFVLARLEREGLSPSAEADRIALIRRLHLDLIGLPPKPEEVDAFLADKSPDAYEKLVEKLLASPHYGERWGRHWLDAARYADSDGYEKDKPRYVFFYRDWVIGAFNRDLPYKQFLTEQVAGDLLPNATQEQRVATGYLRNSMLNEEGGVDPEQFRMDAMFDRMEAIGKGVLGLTIQCAQCHTHKFDPFTHEEYYKLFAFLNNDHEAQPVVYTPAEQQKVAGLVQQMRAIEADLQHKDPDWNKKLAAWEKSVRNDQPAWQVVPLENTGDNSQRYLPQPDGSYLAQGYAPTKLNQTFKTVTDLNGITAIRLELLTDPNLPCGGPGRSFKGTCALTDFKVEVAPADDLTKRKPVKVVDATADFEEQERELEPNFYDKSKDRRVTGPVKFAIDGDKLTAWGIDAGPGRRNTERKAVFKLERPIDVPAGKPIALFVTLQQLHGGWNSDDLMTNIFGRFRVSVTTDPNAKADPLPKRVRESLAVSPAQRSPQQQSLIFSHWRTTVPEWKEANAKIESLWKQWPNGTTTFTLTARPEGRVTQMLSRGDWLKPSKPVTGGVPAVLNPLPRDASDDRLTFAKWLTDEKAPTTARVWVNRIWQQYFGIGIVATSEDFGVQGEAPSHPDLLDWLAVEFMQPTGSDGAKPWSIKHVHRLIVNSATYRQSSKLTKELLARDPYNRLLARGSRFRVEGEIIRDVALAASGLLNPQMGGRSVMPPAPAFIFQPPASYAPFPWVDEKDDQKYRRGVYTYRRRSTPYPVLQTFDVPNAEVSCVRRLRSNTPLQALVSLNESIFVECAAGLARKTLAEGGASDEARLAYAFRRAVSRVPSAEEKQELLSLLVKQRARYEKGELKAEDLLGGAGIDVKELPSGTNANELAAQMIVARVILNLDETITRE